MSPVSPNEFVPPINEIPFPRCSCELSFDSLFSISHIEPVLLFPFMFNCVFFLSRSFIYIIYRIAHEFRQEGLTAEGGGAKRGNLLSNIEL